MIILLSLLLLIVLTALYQLRYGFRKIKATDWETNEDRLTDWDDLFKKSQKLIVNPIYQGISKEESGARPWLNENTIPEDYDRYAPANCPTMNFVIKHKTKGDILIDAGMNSSFIKSHYGDLPPVLKLYQKSSKYYYSLKDGDNIGSYINKYQLDPKYVFITHMHADHVTGLTEIPTDAVTVFGKKENSFFYKLQCGPYLKNRKDIKTLDFDKGKELGPFSKVIDLFGDCSILAISSPGHSEDHISYFVNDSENPTLIVGDLTISEEYFNRGIEINPDSSKRDSAILKKSLKEFGDFKKNYPQVKICFSHHRD